LKKQNTDEQYFWTFKKDEPEERGAPSIFSRAIIKHPTIEGIIWNPTTRFVFRSAVNQVVYAKMKMDNKCLQCLTDTDKKICREYGYNFESLGKLSDGTRAKITYNYGNDRCDKVNLPLPKGVKIEQEFSALALNNETDEAESKV
jgi:hypothetical protein